MNIGTLFPMYPHSFWGAAIKAGSPDREWFTGIVRQENNEFGLGINWKAFREVSPLLAADELLKGKAEASVFYFMESLCKLAAGPRLFYPTVEQCESMENVDVSLPVSDYRQSYPVLGIVLPKEYTDNLRQQINSSEILPKVVICRHYQHLNSLFVCSTNDIQEIWHYAFDTRNDHKDIEETLQNVEKGYGEGFRLATIKLSRVAINLSLLLANTPTKLVPENPRVFEKAQRRLKKRPELQSNAIDVATHIQRIITEQAITIRRHESAGEGTGTHGTPGAHWRRGHWRSQPWGPRNSLRKNIFINPVFVCGGEGIDSNVSVSYKKA
jgi:hypothetical protein